MLEVSAASPVGLAALLLERPGKEATVPAMEAAANKINSRNI